MSLRAVLITLSLLPWTALHAEELTLEPASDVPPPLPEQVDPEEYEGAMEPQVTIIQREEGTVAEYRIGGSLYMVKITPNNGEPYYLVDSDGDGQLETRRNDLDIPPVPRWTILRWK